MAFEWVPNDLIYKICRLWIEGADAVDARHTELLANETSKHPLRAGFIATIINLELNERNIGQQLTRETIRQVMLEVAREKYIFFRPPVEEDGREFLMGFSNCKPEQVEVVDFRDSNWESVSAAVADRAADMSLRLIQQLAKTKKHIHIGLGSGRSSRRVARRLGALLRTAHDLKKAGVQLTVHALSSGFDPEDPLTSPVGTFTLLEESAPPIKFIGLFTDAVVRSGDFERTKELPGVEVSFRKKKSIDLVISSLASANSIGYWNAFVRNNPVASSRLRELGWIGDFQYRPFNAKRPITEDVDIRAMTLFELEDYRKMAAKKNKHVLLVCGPGKTDALVPLLREPALRVWDHLVLSVDTLEEIRTKYTG